ncbi:zinc finger protein 85-like [Centruroides vittatus]|uniref:zinc finger protein 85-like n=1 Tax=Centruroides vittatus TaxID=120091 RepID=UPI00350EF11A
MKIKEELETEYSDFTIERNEENFEVDFKNFKREFNTDEKCYKTIKSEPLEINIKGKPISTNNTNRSNIRSRSGYKIERDIKKEEVKENYNVKHDIKSECKVVLKKLKIQVKTEDYKEIVNLSDNNEQLITVNNEFFTPDENFNENEMNNKIEEEDQIQEHHIQQNAEKEIHFKYNIKTKKYDFSSRKWNKIYDKIKRKYFKVMFASHSKQLFTCDLCKVSFRNKRILQTHLFCHIRKKPFRCTTCNEKFLWQFLLTRHMKKHQTENKNEISHRNLRLQQSGDRVKSSPRNGKIYACKICGKEFKRKNGLSYHEATHSEERPFKCDICNKSFKWKDSLKNHHETHSDELNYVCQVCNKRFKTKHSLKAHKIVHNDKFNHTCHICNKRFKRKSNFTHHITIHSDEYKYSCDICNKYFKLKHCLRKHKLIHSKNVFCDICGKSVPNSKDRLERHKRTHEIHACKICGKEFKSKCALLSHDHTHGEERPFKCDICNKSFKRNDCLKRHQVTHTDECNYTCQVCNKSFKTKQYLELHKIVHNDEFNHTCHLCKKSFKRSSSLKLHINIHTDEYKYTCDICNKYFKTKNNLRCHKLIHSEKSNIKRKNVYCNICGKRVPYNRLERHKRTHEAHACKTCGKEFKWNYMLLQHERTHSEERPFKCDICNKGFKWKMQLNSHLETHTDECNYVCQQKVRFNIEPFCCQKCNRHRP